MTQKGQQNIEWLQDFPVTIEPKGKPRLKKTRKKVDIVKKKKEKNNG